MQYEGLELPLGKLTDLLSCIIWDIASSEPCQLSFVFAVQLQSKSNVKAELQIRETVLFSFVFTTVRAITYFIVFDFYDMHALVKATHSVFHTSETSFGETNAIWIWVTLLILNCNFEEAV